MKVTGGATLHAPIAVVWAALNDPAVLVQAIPGCERLTATAPSTYELTVTAGVGTITGTYTGQISLTDPQPPTAVVLKANGAGSPGTVATDVRVILTEDGDSSTQITFAADATIGGMIAGVGQRMLGAVAKRQADQFFTALDALLVSRTLTPEEALSEPGRQPAGAAGVSSATELAAPAATGMTWERSPMKGQPAGRPGAVPLPAATGFIPGAVVGAGAALAGVVVGELMARRKR